MIPRKRTWKKEKKDKTHLFLFVSLFTKTNFLKKFCLNFITEIDTALHSEKH